MTVNFFFEKQTYLWQMPYQIYAWQKRLSCCKFTTLGKNKLPGDFPDVPELVARLGEKTTLWFRKSFPWYD